TPRGKGQKIRVGGYGAGQPAEGLGQEVPLELKHGVEEFGNFGGRTGPYPDIAFAVAEQGAAGRFQRAILMCGTGIGMSICANKVPGVRAAQPHDSYSAERARKSNYGQVLAMGARGVGPELAKRIVKAWREAGYAVARQ